MFYDITQNFINNNFMAFNAYEAPCFTYNPLPLFSFGTNFNGFFNIQSFCSAPPNFNFFNTEFLPKLNFNFNTNNIFNYTNTPSNTSNTFNNFSFQPNLQPVLPKFKEPTFSVKLTQTSNSDSEKNTPKTNNSSEKTKNKANNNKKSSGNVNSEYSTLSRQAAYNKALTDPKLESLETPGKGWEISTASFRTDIPFAKKGTRTILDNVAKETGLNLVVTSALGTGQAGNPHINSGGYKSHHNAENPKLDLRIPSGMSSAEFANRLRRTGYFSHILDEKDHLDVQIDPAKYSSLQALA